MINKKVVCCAALLFSTLVRATIDLTEVTAPEFGLILSGASDRQFILGTNGSITGTHSTDHISGQSAGHITVTDDTAPLTIEILANNIMTSGGLTVNQVLCSYNAGVQTQCDATALVVASVGNASLKLGLDISTNQVHSGGDTASVTMDINVTYQ
jgi:hypothetical protein